MDVKSSIIEDSITIMLSFISYFIKKFDYKKELKLFCRMYYLLRYGNKKIKGSKEYGTIKNKCNYSR